MAFLGLSAQQLPPASSFEPLPTGWYTVMIIKEEMKPTKLGNGTRLAITYEVLEGQFKKRQLFDGLNLENPNQQAVEISRQTLANMIAAIKFETIPTDSAQFVGKTLQVRVKMDEDQNRITGFKPANAEHANPEPANHLANTAPAWQAATDQAATRSTTSKRPWE